ncbi:MAG: ChbG/HpnK family deacetylase [Acidobacteria bacterium]|nr:ChbG/HpnK family deacetylase [Acidobacteriota bacterium]
MKRLIVNADDFGFTHDVNAGIIEAHRKGILTAATLMATGAAFPDAVELARENPSLDIGCHLVLVNAPSALDSGRPLPRTVSDLLKQIVARRMDVYGELRAQIEKTLAAGLCPTHLDTHKHTHLFPPVLEAVARLGQEFRIPWVRQPFDFPLTAAGVPWTKRVTSRAFGLVRRRFQGVLARHGCRSTDHFAGFRITGRFRTPELVALIAALPEGLTELMCHPGRCTEELLRAPTRLKASRQQELDALLAPATRGALTRHGVELASYRA